ncbi:6-phosphogluconolactonase [Nitratireductor indicus C115]|uniref:6-phosphogluconolactonase n=1 Tax=Nitratireductor indicus C115 TaxID=1231190 RepID=K2N071_9HYPH|nr:6-phosphogluconolactonase [Nitratireductor indicus]EKF40913.1 6-phosphogluconolactonase [Nitratireductor indicus C115]SFQ32623.1 6-phosphogluconolactonase [Nitratireductor indicus]
MVPTPTWHRFASSEELADALAQSVAKTLAKGVEERGQAVLAVSGGRTPAHFFDRLSRSDIAWNKVTVTLVDERFVPGDSPRSNARLVTRHLLQNKAARAGFIGLYSPCHNAEAAAAEANEAIGSLPSPFDVVVLGMGADRHTASFFPDAADIGDMLSAREGGPSVLAVSARSAGEPRLTLSLDKLSTARMLVVHIEGDDKKETLEEALAMPAGPASPIGAVLTAAQNPAHVYWAPLR